MECVNDRSKCEVIWGICEVFYRHLTCLHPSVCRAFRYLMWGCEVCSESAWVSAVHSVPAIVHLRACRLWSLCHSFDISMPVVWYLWACHLISLSVSSVISEGIVSHQWLATAACVTTTWRICWILHPRRRRCRWRTLRLQTWGSGWCHRVPRVVPCVQRAFGG